MKIWTVYRQPKDYPQSYVARLFENNVPTQKVIVRDTLEAVREEIEREDPGMVSISRSESDDPVIVESWL